MRAFQVDLSQAGTQILVPSGTMVGSLTVLDIPPSSVIPLQVGQTTAYALYYRGQVIRLCGGAQDGLNVTIPSGMVGVLLVALDLETAELPEEPAVSELAVFDAMVGQRDNGLAGAHPRVQLQNPLTSGKRLYVIETELNTAATAHRLSIGVTANFKGAAIAGAAQPRSPSAPASVAVVTGIGDGGAADRSSGADGVSDFAFGILAWNAESGTNPMPELKKRFRPPLVLAPGRALSAEMTSTANSAPIMAGFSWFER